MTTNTHNTAPAPQEPSCEATAPVLKPGIYRLNPDSGRWWRDDELEVVRHDGRWCVVPVVALARLPESEP